MAVRANEMRLRGNGFAVRLAVLGLFVFAFAFFEAAVVFYLRQIVTTGVMIHLPLIPRFPAGVLLIEQSREVSTLVLLGSLAWLLGRRWWEKLAVFCGTFALWNLGYYLCLFLLIHFPPSLATWNVVCLVPCSWWAPYWLVMVIMLAMLAVAFVLLHRSARMSVFPAVFPPGSWMAVGQWVGVLTLFGIAMAHLESVVVIYQRLILIPTGVALPNQAALTLPGWLIDMEQYREAATILMLGTLAWLIGRTHRERWAVFLWAFAVWDIGYYVSLKICTGWPASLATTDLLFLVPVPWYAPVWLPVLVSCGMLGIAGWLFHREQQQSTA